MPFCPYCGRCKRTARVVSDREISNLHFVRDVRSFAFRLSKRPSEWLDFVLELLARFDGCVLDDLNRPIQLDIEIFLPSDEEIDGGRAAAVDARIRNWFGETFSASVPNSVNPRVRMEARERFRIVATTLRAHFPAEALMWGVRAANDNFAAIPPSDDNVSA